MPPHVVKYGNDDEKDLFPSGLPDIPDLTGASFVLHTSSPPFLQEHLYSNAILSYREEDMTSSSFFQRNFTKPAIYFTSVRTQSYPRISISRQELCRAWVLGLNGMRFHSHLFTHIWRTCKALNENEKDNLWILRRAKQEWGGCFLELDWALGVLRKFETSHYLLQEWKPVEHLDLRDITPLFKSHDGNEEFEDISDTFIHAAHHLIKLSELGYSKECLSLVEVSGFDLDILLHCYVPGLGLPLPKSNEAPSQELQKQTLSSEANLRHLKPSP